MTDLFQPDDKSSYAEYIPGDTSKYRTQEDLAKGAYEKDRHIKTLERENAELRQTNIQIREDNQKKANMEDYIDQITRIQSQQNLPPSEGTNPKPNDDQPFNHQQMRAIFSEQIKAYEAAKTKEQNAKLVEDALVERYGHNYQDVLQTQIKDLGLSREAVNFLAETAPKAFFRTLGLDQAPKTENFQAPPKKSPFFAPTAEPERSWSFYKKMQKENPSQYNNPKTQEQMMKDYQRLGSKFEDGDFLSYGQESAF